jgi:D-psicose/D-tagatose/L-ribulose 3-epimerase
MRFGCCVGTLEQIDILARAGFDFCELPAAMVQPFDDDAKALPGLRAIASAPLKPESFNVLVPAVLPLAGPKMDLAALRTYLRRAFGRMVRLGAPVVVLGSGGARRIPDGTPREQGLNQLAESLSVALEEANRAGIVLALEHLNRAETNTLNSIAESQAFIEQRGLKGLKLLADLHHIEMEHEPMATVVAAAPFLAHVHVADGGRRAPGAGGYDYAGFMRALRQAGYDQRISAECGWDDLSAQAAGALEYMKQSWEQSTNSRE